MSIDAEAPAALTSCNCSICRRHGGLFGYFPPQQVKVLADEGATQEYIWGDRSLALVRCSQCGCVSHWRSLDPKQIDRMGVNARLLLPGQCDFSH